MLSLAQLQTQLIQSQHVHLNRYRFSSAYIQQSSIPRKPRVSIPTSKHLQNNALNKPNRFYELPTGVNSDSLVWKLNGLGSQAILEVPKEIVSFFPDNDELYTTQYEGNSGVWYAVLFALDPEFITRTMGNQEKCVKEAKQQMCIELDDYYHKYRYRQYGYTKSNMDRILTHSDEYHATLGHYFTDFMGINVLVLLENKRFHWLGRFDENRVTTVLYHKGMSWFAIAHSDQKTHLWNVHTIKDMIAHLGHVQSLDASQQHENIILDADVLLKLKRELKAMKLIDLQERAQLLEIDICNELGKKKLKKQLQTDVYKQLTGCNEFQ